MSGSHSVQPVATPVGSLDLETSFVEEAPAVLGKRRKLTRKKKNPNIPPPLIGARKAALVIATLVVMTVVCERLPDWLDQREPITNPTLTPSSPTFVVIGADVVGGESRMDGTTEVIIGPMTNDVVIGLARR